jgi:hypothetical protein
MLRIKSPRYSAPAGIHGKAAGRETTARSRRLTAPSKRKVEDSPLLLFTDIAAYGPPAAAV